MVRKILLIAYNGVTALDLVGPMQVFSTASGYSKATTGVALYDLAVASVDGGAVATSTGLHILARPFREIGLEQIDTIIVPGGRPNDNSVFDTRLVAWLAENGPRSRRVCSVCVGRSSCRSGLACWSLCHDALGFHRNAKAQMRRRDHS